jgi:hypothetical protein
MIKTFRGSLVGDEIDTIHLHTINGSTGYRITKFDVLPGTTSTADQVSIIKILKVSEAATTTIDFEDQKLLAAGIFRAGNLLTEMMTSITVFDQEVFNQDIYVSLKSLDADIALNYYIELETIELDLGENTVATLKDIRNVKTQGF